MQCNVKIKIEIQNIYVAHMLDNVDTAKMLMRAVLAAKYWQRIRRLPRRREKEAQ